MNGHDWDGSLETGDPIVDQQHRNIHMLVDFVERSQDEPEAIMRALQRLMEHVDCHFATEEELMQRTGYTGPAAQDHIADHRRLTQEARDVVLKYRRGEIVDTAPVVEFLRSWLSGHVHTRDRVFIEHVQAQGAAAAVPEPWASSPPEPLDDRVA